MVRTWRAAATLLSFSLLTTCATNPVTGKKELSLVSESQEISLGKEYAAEVAQSIGLYDDPAVQSYVMQLGRKLAAKTERPNLPWSFQVVDDPVVNAFALPGGFIFITRGIMTNMRNEAELATVIGHEIGHVTARHSVQQMSRAQVAQLGLGVGSILSSQVRKYGQAASTGLGVLFLKFGRDDETQADQLGFRYALNDNYDVREMARVFQTLQRVSQQGGGGGRLPQWLSTHPDPENRIKATERRVATLEPSRLSGTVTNEDAYLSHIDGMVYGENPRQGYFEGALFLHPDLKFQFEFPEGWKTQNQAQAVVGVSPEEDAIVQLSLGKGTSPSAAAQQFFGQEGMQAGQLSRNPINGNPAVSGSFTAQGQQSTLRGEAAFISYGGATYQILAYTGTDKFRSYDPAFRRTIGSFRHLTDQAALNAQPMRVELVKLARAMTLEQFNRQYPSSVPIEQVALINEVEVGGSFASGETVKRVVGGRK